MKIIIGGDLVPTKSNEELFNKANTNALLGEELLSIWNSADFRIFNLEVPLTDTENPIDKWGPNLIAPKSTINGIKELKPSLITLANNHIMDQGVQGLKSTENLLREHSIPFIGTGINPIEASKPYIIRNSGLKIGVYACAEHEFSIVTNNSPGANHFDPLESLDHIQVLKKECAHVIVLYHGGKEYYRYPSPYLQKVCRKMVDKGADLVVCQHSHCIGCYEEYKDSIIVYGQGDFIFDNSNNEYRQTSLLVMADFSDGIKIEYIPIEKKGNCVRLAKGQAMEDILSKFHYRSTEILEEEFIMQKYQEFSEVKILSYLRALSGLGKLVSRIDKYLFQGILVKCLYNKSKLLSIRNYIECEAHRELLLSGIKLKISKKVN